MRIRRAAALGLALVLTSVPAGAQDTDLDAARAAARESLIWADRVERVLGRDRGRVTFVDRLPLVPSDDAPFQARHLTLENGRSVAVLDGFRDDATRAALLRTLTHNVDVPDDLARFFGESLEQPNVVFTLTDTGHLVVHKGLSREEHDALVTFLRGEGAASASAADQDAPAPPGDPGQRSDRLGAEDVLREEVTVPVSGKPTAAPSDALAEAAPATPERQVTVARGDTVWDLAQAHRVTTPEIMRRNGLRPGDPILQPGQELTIPAPGERKTLHVIGPDGQSYHWLQEGDTPSEIAQTYGISLAELRRLNPEGGDLRAGHLLRLPPQAAPSGPVEEVPLR